MRDSLARVFPRIASAAYIYSEIWLVRWIVCVLWDWPGCLFFSFTCTTLNCNPLYRVDETQLGLARKSKRFRKESRRCPFSSSGFNFLLVLSRRRILTRSASVSILFYFPFIFRLLDDISNYLHCYFQVPLPFYNTQVDDRTKTWRDLASFHLMSWSHLLSE